jgi:hypothetical protein
LVFLPPHNPFILPYIFQSLSNQWWISNARDNLDSVNGSACVDVDPIYHSYLRGAPSLRPLPSRALLRQHNARRGVGGACSALLKLKRGCCEFI